ncbi:hypothetical protein J7L67_02220 [bacterium]|nr:hypothetical protein [bacterium]
MAKNAYVICSPDITQTMREKLISFGWDIITVPRHAKLLGPLQGHPDLQLFVIDNETVIIHPDAPDFFIRKIKMIFKNVFFGKSHLAKKYPADICYNGKIAGGCFIHTLNFTDAVLKKIIDDKKLSLINVTQGYTGCSVLKISDNAVITSDENIAEKAVDNGIDTLKIDSGNIYLPGMSCGFIGGAGGWDGYDTVYFCGDIKTHPDHKEIVSFIKKQNKNSCCLSDGRLLDLGSLLFIRS